MERFGGIGPFGERLGIVLGGPGAPRSAQERQKPPNRLQKKMLETAAAPMVEMTKDLLEQQKVLIYLYIFVYEVMNRQ